MALYQKFLDSIKGLKSSLSKDPTTMDNVSGAIAAEFLIFVSLILAALFKIRAIRFLGKNDILCCGGSWNFSCSNLLGVKICLIKLLVLDH